MYKMKRIIATLLTLVTLVAVLLPLLSCKDNEGESQGTGSNAGGQFGGVNYNGRTFRINMDSSQKVSSYIEPSDTASGDIVEAALFERNEAVCELLNIDLSVTYFDFYDGSGPTYGKMKDYLLAGLDEFDLLINEMRSLVMLARDNALINVYSQNNVTDFSQPYWNESAMKDLQFYDEGRYVLIGDMFTNYLASTGLLFYNRDMLEDIGLGRDYLKDLAYSGGWTLDKMNEVLTLATIDETGDQAFVVGDDILGMATAGFGGGTHFNLFTVGAGIQFISRDSDGKITFAFGEGASAERSVDYLTKINTMYWSNVWARETNTSDTLFKNERVFMVAGCFENLVTFRGTEFVVGMVPIPKLNEAQTDYYTTAGAAALVGGIPLTLPDEDLEFAYTCIEAFSKESRETVLPAFYDQALKIKYVEGQDDGEMIDFIRDQVSSPFAYAYDWVFENFVLKWCFRELVGQNTPTKFASIYKSWSKKSNKALAETYSAFQYNLSSGN